VQSSAEPPVTFTGSRTAAALLRAAGWTLRFEGLPARQGVIVVYPVSREILGSYETDAGAGAHAPARSK